MTKEEFAEMLDGSEYPFNLSPDNRKLAKAFRFLVVNGASDDLVEFDGIFAEELNAYQGTTAHVTIEGELLPEVTEDDAEVLKKHGVLDYVQDDLRTEAIKIEAEFEPPDSDYAWLIKTEAPHAEFDIMEDGEKFCRGIVLQLR